MFFFFSSRRRHTRSDRDWSSDVCSSDLLFSLIQFPRWEQQRRRDAFEEQKVLDSRAISRAAGSSTKGSTNGAASSAENRCPGRRDGQRTPQHVRTADDRIFAAGRRWLLWGCRIESRLHVLRLLPEQW